MNPNSKKLLVATDLENPDFGVMTDRNKVSNGLYRFGNSPVASKIMGISNEHGSSRQQILDMDPGKFVDYRTISNEMYLIATNVASHPNQWTGHIDGIEKNLSSADLPDRKNLFECIIPECMEHLQQGQAVILLDQTHEGYNAPWLWEWFYLSLERFKIPAKNVIYVTGDLMSPDLHDAWCEKTFVPTNERINVFGHCLFEEAVCHASLRENSWKHEHITFEDHVQYKLNNLQHIKTFNCLQKRLRNHRLWLFKEFYDREILDFGICTMNRVDESMLLNPQGGFSGSMHFQNEAMGFDIIKNLNKMLPLMPEKYKNYQSNDIDMFSHEDSGKWQMMLNRDILLDSWVSVISEAGADEYQCFCSEKIFKPIVQEHPFLVWGDKYTMAKLQELGYQTFSNWWSEAWDSKDMRHRLNGMCDVIEDLTRLTDKEMLSMYIDMRDVLKHNSSLMNRKTQEQIDDELKFIVGEL